MFVNVADILNIAVIFFIVLLMLAVFGNYIFGRLLRRRFRNLGSGTVPQTKLEKCKN